jgi:hypothetical protein
VQQQKPQHSPKLPVAPYNTPETYLGGGCGSAHWCCLVSEQAQDLAQQGHQVGLSRAADRASQCSDGQEATLTSILVLGISQGSRDGGEHARGHQLNNGARLGSCGELSCDSLSITCRSRGQEDQRESACSFRCWRSSDAVLHLKWPSDGYACGRFCPVSLCSITVGLPTNDSSHSTMPSHCMKQKLCLTMSMSVNQCWCACSGFKLSLTATQLKQQLRLLTLSSQPAGQLRELVGGGSSRRGCNDSGHGSWFLQNESSSSSGRGSATTKSPRKLATHRPCCSILTRLCRMHVAAAAPHTARAWCKLSCLTKLAAARAKSHPDANPEYFLTLIRFQ